MNEPVNICVEWDDDRDDIALASYFSCVAPNVGDKMVIYRKEDHPNYKQCKADFVIVTSVVHFVNRSSRNENNQHHEMIGVMVVPEKSDIDKAIDEDFEGRFQSDSYHDGFAGEPGEKGESGLK